ncbi:unnamed protein product [Calypogeia fissa]
MTILQKRLILTPKASSPLGSVPLRPEIAKLLDPNPDFDLIDIRLELQRIEAKYAGEASPSTGSRDGTASTTPASGKRFGGNLSEVADFGRKGFRMSLLDSGLFSDDSDEDIPEENQGRRISYEKNGIQGKENQNQNAQFGVNAERSEWASSPILPKTDEVEAALLVISRERILRVQDETKQTHVIFEEKFREEQRQAAARFAQLEKEEAIRRERARRIDKQDQRMIAEARDQHLSVLQRDHEQRSQVEERAIRKEAAAEEARRREVQRVRELQRRAREEAEAEARKKTEAEQEKARAEAAKRKAQADAAAAAALQRVEAERKSKLDAEQKAKLEAEKKAKDLAIKEAEQKAKQLAIQEAAKAGSVPKPRVSEEAARLEEGRLNKLKELQDSYKHLAMDPALKKDFKVYERQLIKHLQQVSATQEQVRKKSAELIQLFRTPNGPPIQFLIVTLGTKILSQCESQVQKLPSFAFALAQVVVNVASQVPFVMESVLAQLHQVCIFTVPKYYVFSKNQFPSDEAYYKALGYKEDGGKLESTDDYVARMNAYMTFYAALTQTEVYGGANPHGLKEGWSWCARLLNRIPANRLSASALEAYLKTAGFRLFQTYPKPFMMLMQAVVSEFLVSLKNHDDADAKAVVYRLETYLHTGQFKSPPEGRNMPVTDISSQLRA